jgi:signal transduction histidine kinase
MKQIQRFFAQFSHRQIGIFGIFGFLVVGLVAAMIVLVTNVLFQSQTITTVMGFNNTDVVRPFVQIQRETLRLINLVHASATDFDPDAVQLQYDLLLSRFHVLDAQSVQGTFTEQTKQQVAEVSAIWNTVKPLVQPWQENHTDATARQNLLKGLTDLELLTNRVEIDYQQNRGELLSTLNGTSEATLLGLLLASIALVLLLSGLFFTIYRFSVQRREAQEAIRIANAEKQAAIETNRFKDQFLAIMSHELRTPLNAIIGFMGVIAMSNTLNERNSFLLQRARFNADRLLTLINDILDLSRIESGRFEIIPSEFQLRKLVEKWETHTDILAKEKGLALIINIDSKLPDQLYMDEDALTKITTNLLSNAIKFTQKGSVQLDLRLQDDSNWVIQVTDTGIGIPGHMHEVIFESFRQVDSSYTRSYGGTGLGLSIVQRLVKALGGTIRVTSEPGAGSTFTVTLPLTRKDAMPQLEKLGVNA